jgi:hypothetical protein
MDADELWCRITVFGPDGSELLRSALGGPGRPDVGTVDDVARLALHAVRLGGTLAITDLSPDLRALLDLAGLVVEVEGQAEGGEEALVVEEVEEELHPDDPPV